MNETQPVQAALLCFLNRALLFVCVHLVPCRGSRSRCRPRRCCSRWSPRRVTSSCKRPPPSPPTRRPPAPPSPPRKTSKSTMDYLATLLLHGAPISLSPTLLPFCCAEQFSPAMCLLSCSTSVERAVVCSGATRVTTRAQHTVACPKGSQGSQKNYRERHA